MRQIISLLFLLSLLAVPAPEAGAWAKKGHEIVAQIAMQYMQPQTRANVLYLLQHHTPEETATWMDDIKGQHINRYMNRWHYVNIERGAVYTGADSPNVITQIRAAHQYLQQAPASQDADGVLLNLRVLFHLTGDLHQPLHTGYGTDKGGNNVQVRLGNRGTNLHHVWDNEIISKQHISLNDCMALGNSLKPATIRGIGRYDMMGWVNESRSLLPVVYDFKDRQLDDAYMIRNRAIVIKQLVYAGIRLAAMLDNSIGRRPIQEIRKNASGRGTVAASAAQGRLQTYRPADAPQLIGERVRICGRIAATKAIEGGKGMMFFFDTGEYRSPFAIVIFEKDYPKFSFRPEQYLRHRQVCVTGFVKSYKGQAEIIVRSARQLDL